MITVSEAATMKGVTRQAVYDAIKGKKLPSVQSGSIYLLWPKDVQAWKPREYTRRAAASRKEEPK